MNNPFDLSKTGTAQNNNAAGTFDSAAPGKDQFAAIAPSIGSTVQGQMSSLLSSDSPYLKQARTRAAQQANSRGLLNSSMAAGAGEAAAIDAALPIAQQDASTFFTAQRANQDAGNQLGLINQQFQNQQTLQGDQNQFVGQQSALDRQQQMGILNRELQSIEGRQTQQIASTERMSNADNQLRQALLSTQIQSEKDLTTMRAALEQEQNAFLAQLQDEQSLLAVTRGRNASIQQYQLQMGNEFMNDANAILSSTAEGLTAEMKLAAVEQMKKQYQSLLDLAGSLANMPVLATGQAGV